MIKCVFSTFASERVQLYCPYWAISHCPTSPFLAFTSCIIFGYSQAGIQRSKFISSILCVVKGNMHWVYQSDQMIYSTFMMCILARFERNHDEWLILAEVYCCLLSLPRLQLEVLRYIISVPYKTSSKSLNLRGWASHIDCKTWVNCF